MKKPGAFLGESRNLESRLDLGHFSFLSSKFPGYFHLEYCPPPVRSARPAQPNPMTMTDKAPSGTKSSAMLNNALLSSPPRAPSSRGKERRNPSITPRKFQRFFTPRSRVSSQPSAARKALRDLAGPALNRCQTPSSPLKPISEEYGADDLPSYPVSKRRKVQHAPNQLAQLPSPLNTSPLLPTAEIRPGLGSPIRSLRSRRERALQDDLGLDDSASEDDEAPPSPKRCVTLPRRGLGAQLVQRMTGGMPRGGDYKMRHPVAGMLDKHCQF